MAQSQYPLRPGCSVDLTALRLTVGGEERRLTAREAEVLAYLLDREGEDVSVDDLHADVWGLHPRVLSRAARNTVHRLKQKIEREPSRPELLLTIHGVGFRLVRSPDVTDEASSPGTALVGRDELVDEVASLLGDAVLVTLVGLGGIGKTRVAQAVLERTGGVWVDLVEAADAVALRRSLATALGLPRAGACTESVIGRVLARRGGVVVLDNVEQLVAPTVRILRRLRDLAPDVGWLTTSRVRLGAPEEHVVEVPPLPGGSRRSPAVQLFLDRAAGDPGPGHDVVALVDQLQGIPLAIELAAGRTNVLAAAEISARLSDPALLCRAGGGRHDALKTVIEVSWSLLSPAARSVLVQCAALGTPFTMDAAETHVRVPPDAYLLDVLQELVDASLLRRASGAGLEMFVVVREFAAARDRGPTVHTPRGERRWALGVERGPRTSRIVRGWTTSYRA